MIPLLLCAVQAKSTLPEVKMGTAQLVFLIEPSDAPKFGGNPDETQKKHLAFLQELYQKRTALIVGPLEDAGDKKGLLVLDVATAAEADKILQRDPWIAARQLKPECHTWFFAKNYVLKGPKFLDVEPLWFGLLERPANAPSLTKEESEKVQAGHMANITKMAEAKQLLLAGPFEEDTALRGIFIFKNLKPEQIEKLTAGDPAIARGRLKLTLLRWYSPKGSFLMRKK